MVQKILLVSANGMFREGLFHLLLKKKHEIDPEIKQAKTNREALLVIQTWQPDLIILDFDDHTNPKEELLKFFIESQFSLKMILVSLLSNGSVVVYDRRNLIPEEGSEFLSNLSL